MLRCENVLQKINIMSTSYLTSTTNKCDFYQSHSEFRLRFLFTRLLVKVLYYTLENTNVY